MLDKFQSIRTYNEEEAKTVFYQLIENKVIKNVIETTLPDFTLQDLIDESRFFTSIYDFQQAFSKRFIDFYVKQSTTSVIYQGIENIDRMNQYLFIGNHRDITFDPALLQNYFFNNRFNTSKIAIGDNLLSSPLLEMIAKINKMFVVKRSVSIREKMANYQLLSQYIQYSIFEEGESVWIAQRDGRTKNGFDETKRGLIKMLTINNEIGLIESLKKLKITPVAVSYEYEPCDSFKARELALSKDQPYKKKEGEDFESIKEGVFGFKGNIHLVIGTPIIQELESIDPNIRINDCIDHICKLIDQQIYNNYYIYPNNYIAFDIIENCTDHHLYYTFQQKESFIKYLKKKSIVNDVSQDEMMHYLLTIYANPIRMKQSI